MSVEVEWLVTQSISILTAVLTSFLLPRTLLAVCQSFDVGNETALLLTGKLLATPIIPCVVTFLYQADCLGAWVFFWQPCVDPMSNMASRTEVSQRVGHAGYMIVKQQLVTRDEVSVNLGKKKLVALVLFNSVQCFSRRRQGCVDAVLDRASYLLYASYIHLALTMMVPGRHPNFEQSPLCKLPKIVKTDFQYSYC
eukprot:3570971-Amphidinium_carterae.1